jgi:hypothetical protein
VIDGVMGVVLIGVMGVGIVGVMRIQCIVFEGSVLWVLYRIVKSSTPWELIPSWLFLLFLSIRMIGSQGAPLNRPILEINPF